MAESPKEASEGNILKELKKLSHVRYNTWNDLFSKYSQMYPDDDDISFAFDDFSSVNKVTHKVSPEKKYEAKLVKKIEKKYKSNFYELLAHREKMRILNDFDGFAVAEKRVRQEVKRLLKYLEPKDLENYAALRFIVKDKVTQVVTKHLRGEFGKALINQIRSAGNPQKFSHCNTFVKVLWDFLTGVLSDEDITVYAVGVLRDYITWRHVLAVKST